MRLVSNCRGASSHLNVRHVDGRPVLHLDEDETEGVHLSDVEAIVAVSHDAIFHRNVFRVRVGGVGVADEVGVGLDGVGVGVVRLLFGIEAAENDTRGIFLLWRGGEHGVFSCVPHRTIPYLL